MIRAIATSSSIRIQRIGACWRRQGTSSPVSRTSAAASSSSGRPRRCPPGRCPTRRPRPRSGQLHLRLRPRGLSHRDPSATSLMTLRDAAPGFAGATPAVTPRPGWCRAHARASALSPSKSARADVFASSDGGEACDSNFCRHQSDNPYNVCVPAASTTRTTTSSSRPHPSPIGDYQHDLDHRQTPPLRPASATTAIAAWMTSSPPTPSASISLPTTVGGHARPRHPH